MPDMTSSQETTFGPNGDYHRILANVALYFMAGGSSLAGTFTFQKEHRTREMGLGGIEAYRAAALSNVDKLALDELAHFIRLETPTGSANLSDSELLSVAKELIAREIVEEKLDGKTYYLKARLVADPQEISQAINIVQEIDNKIEELNKAKSQAEEALREVQRLEQEVKLAKIKAELGRGAEQQGPIEDEQLEEQFKKAKELLTSGDYEGAIEIYTSLLEKNKREFEALVYRGAAYFHLMQYEQALQDFSRAAVLDPFSPLPYHNRASCKVKIGRAEDAIEDYTRSIELEENYSDAYRNRGITYLKYLGRYQLALDDFQKLVDLRANDSSAYFLRGTAYGKLGRFEEAIEDYVSALESLKNDPWLHYNAANCLLRMCRYSEAIDSYSKAIELRSDVALFYHNRGLAYAREGFLEEALEDYNRALALGPEDGKSLVIRGFLLWKRGDKEAAKRDWERAGELGETKGIEFLNRLNGG